MHLIFDLDGTLIDSLPGIAASLNRALEERELPTHPLAAVRRFVGDGAFVTARRAIPHGEPDSLAREVERAFQHHYTDYWPEGTTLYPGIGDLIAELRGGAHHLAVVSNKPHGFSVEICERLFPPGTFGVIEGQRNSVPKKPAPDMALRVLKAWDLSPDQARFIGDSTVDLRTAAAAGIPFIGVAWGYHDPENLGLNVARDAASLCRLITTLG
ncbi:MAG: HAD-IA family hydrolase [Verrucomicrobiota bacterium]